MYRETVAAVVSKGGLLDLLLSALNTRPAAALIVDAEVHLFTAGLSPIPPSWVPADFTDATFLGYDPAPITDPLNGPFNNELESGRLMKYTVTFSANDSIVSPGQVILGYYVKNGDTGSLIAELFDEPVNIVSPGDFLELSLSFFLKFVQDTNS